MARKVERILPFRDQGGASSDVEGLLNLGPKSSAWLAAAGIHTIEQVRRLGPVGVCRQLFEHGRPVAVVLAYAIEGGLAGVHWNAIPWEAKETIRADFARMKAALPKSARRPR